MNTILCIQFLFNVLKQQTMESREKIRQAARQSHVLVFPYPIQGHINPMLQFSKRLASQGLKVTLIITTSLAKTMQVPQQSSINVETIFDGFKDGEKASTPKEYIATFQATAPKSLAELIEKHGESSEPVNCVVYDSIIPWVLDVARRFGIYGASFFTQSCAVTGLYYHKTKGALKEVCLEEENSVLVPCYPEMEVDDLPSFLNGAGSYPFIYDLAFSQVSNLDEVDWLLCNTFNGLEDEVVNWMAKKWPIMTIGPTIPSMFIDKQLEDDKDYGLSLFKPNSEACINWLHSKQPSSVVYVSFGSLAALGDAQMAELAWGLKRSNCNFLWVVRESEEKKLPTNFLDEITEDKGIIVKWSPQLEVLAHRSVGCFVTHCGWNSTLEALSLGVPMVAMPQWTDQPTNAKFVADVWRVGVRVKTDENGIVTQEEIEKCIKEVMEGESGKEIRRNSEKWNKVAKTALDEGGGSDKNIQKFVTLLCTSINGSKD
ncbi:UDP-glycosyltransferase 74E1-like [Mercurialis annua]|uniref:UDP-glycosyltransferase 74E1-like n=1 Tax=Mercurialis annua TaxID=3986 RepID=UPI002160A3F7|nr:UDP-glycosyltransferase 74E1-like [Mercurialis annua]